MLKQPGKLKIFPKLVMRLGNIQNVPVKMHPQGAMCLAENLSMSSDFAPLSIALFYGKLGNLVCRQIGENLQTGKNFIFYLLQSSRYLPYRLIFLSAASIILVVVLKKLILTPLHELSK